MKKTYVVSVFFFFYLFLLGMMDSERISAARQTDAAVRKDQETVRVGFPMQAGFSEKDEEGNPTGYTVDYLSELTKYTNWNVEYVEVEGEADTQMETLMDMLSRGEIDMMGAMYSSEAMEKKFAYPTYFYGMAYTILAVKEDLAEWLEDDYANWGVMRVAVSPDMEDKLSALEKFSEVSGFQYEVVPCEKKKEACHAVLEGKADACLQMDVSMEEGFRAAGRFSPKPYYFILNKERTDLLQDMNSCMGSLLQACPNLQSELYTKYFSRQGAFCISEQNKKWMASLGSMRVLFFDGNAPIQSVEQGKAAGVAETFFSNLSKQTGLSFDPVIAKNYEEGRRLINEKKVDLVAAVPNDALLNADCVLKLSLPYFTSNSVIVSASKTSNSDPKHRQDLSANTQALLTVLNKDPELCAMLDINSVNYYMRKTKLYDNLSIDYGVDEPILYCVGFTGAAEPRLIAIVNSFIKSMGNDVRREMLYMNNSHPVTYSMGEVLYVFRYWIFWGILTSAFLIFNTCLYRRNKELKRSKAESERLYQFSMMTDECLFEYDYRKDKLMLQNNHILFPEEHIIHRFMRKAKEHTYTSESEKKCIGKLIEMLTDHKEKDNVLLDIDGTETWYKLKIVYIAEDHAVGRLIDNSQDVKEMQALERKANTDQLTGLMNRSALEKGLKTHLEESSQDGVYLLLDLDNFKQVNDTFGHQSGDDLLVEFARALDREFRKTDYKARLGGDEFVVFLPNAMGEEELKKKLSTFIQEIQKEIFGQYTDCNVSVSIGAAYTSQRANTAETLYREADVAMYVAKYGGKNDFFISDGTTCMRRECVNCRTNCKRKEYLKMRGISYPARLT
ncbi:MAG: diguanylate cyclase [Eubacteriales bacterium]|nr:diguanylate cyclase [Eubacteriales bacterium]